ncbi:MAG: hydroxyisourate hydrolase [Stappiaceae bacterium]
MGRLTTHVLDTSSGKPAAGLKITLWRLSDERQLMQTARTNDDGRVDGPMLSGDAFSTGSYELNFHAADYLKAQDIALPDIPFLDVIVIRFGISSPDEHYHVPLLLSPYGYSTYRGS